MMQELVEIDPEIAGKDHRTKAQPRIHEDLCSAAHSNENSFRLTT